MIEHANKGVVWWFMSVAVVGPDFMERHAHRPFVPPTTLADGFGVESGSPWSTGVPVFNICNQATTGLVVVHGTKRASRVGNRGRPVPLAPKFGPGGSGHAPWGGYLSALPGTLTAKIQRGAHFRLPRGATSRSEPDSPSALLGTLRAVWPPSRPSVPVGGTPTNVQ